tara:strand:- start:490 stop:1791 length:1302 start_codon:yes stop_codon:yes gene_type:complete
MLYSANNAKLKINDKEILASNAELSLGASLSANYLMRDRHTSTFTSSNGIGGTLNFSFYLTGRDFIKSFVTGQGEIPQGESQIISGNFGGLYFDSGYLTSYSVSFSPNSPAAASASIAFFSDLSGQFVSTSSAPPADVDVLNFSNAVVESQMDVGIGANNPRRNIVNNFVAGTYNYSANVAPVYLMNETKPSRVSFGEKTINANFEIDNPTGTLPFSGSDAKIEVGLKRFNNELIVMGDWALRAGAANDNYNPFASSSDNGDVSATWDGPGYGIADSTPFVVNPSEVFTVSFDLALQDAAPQFQLVNHDGTEKKGWSTAQTLSNGSNSFTVTVSPTNESVIINRGEYAVFQIWNTSTSEWTLTNLKVVRTTSQPSEVFSCSGVMQSRSIASAAGDYIKQSISIIESNVEETNFFASYLIDSSNNSQTLNIGEP